jgi:hypothetical protein
MDCEKLLVDDRNAKDAFASADSSYKARGAGYNPRSEAFGPSGGE